MRSLLLSMLLLLSSFSPQNEASGDVLRQMYLRYHGHWHKTLKFIQHTEKYRNDSLTGTDTWYETIEYPKSFRIDFGLPSLGNCVIFRNDSAYIFKNSTLVKSRVDSNDLLFLLGGMYFSPTFKDVATRFDALGINHKATHKTIWKGEPVHVIGAATDDEQLNQIWVSERDFKMLRSVKFEGGKREEAVFERHKKIDDGGWCETMVTFYVDGQLKQKET